MGSGALRAGQPCLHTEPPAEPCPCGCSPSTKQAAGIGAPGSSSPTAPGPAARQAGPSGMLSHAKQLCFVSLVTEAT